MIKRLEQLARVHLPFGHNKQNPVIGGDPEFFVGTKSRGRVLPADKFFPGKKRPLLIGEGVQNPSDETIEFHNKLFFDGIQGEMGPIPSRCRDDVNMNIKRILEVVAKKIGPNRKIMIKPSVKVSKATIEGADPEARIFGCMPDYNAYTLGINTPPMDASEHPYRYSGGHIHFGMYSKSDVLVNSREYTTLFTPEGHIQFIKMLDLTAGVLSVLLDNTVESRRRRDKYGKAGCFRDTPYGVEYRTMSCWWLKSPMLSSMIMGLCRLAWTIMTTLDTEKFLEDVSYNEDEVRQAIDESDTKTALRIWNNLLPGLMILGSHYSNPVNINTCGMGEPHCCQATTKGGKLKSLKFDEHAVKNAAIFGPSIVGFMIENGIGALISDDISSEWQLNTGTDEYGRGFRRIAIAKGPQANDYRKFHQSFVKDLFS